MPSLLEMARGMDVRRVIAAADDPADHAQPHMRPLAANLESLYASLHVLSVRVDGELEVGALGLAQLPGQQSPE